MILCPSDEHLASLLDESLNGPDLVTIETHLERCARCQQVLEELTYQRFSAAEWRESVAPHPAASSSAQAQPSPGGDAVASSFFDPAVQSEQDSRRKRLILDSHPRNPSSYRIAPDERAGSSTGEEVSHAYPPQVEGYDIVGRLGRGGMGVVYRARQHGLDRLVALKMLRGGSHADPEALARFRIEVRAVARLHHPNVVQVFDVGESQGLPFVSLELLEGGSLESRISGVPQPDAEAATLVATLARAVASAHRAGIVHRDLKSANILFTRDGIPKITDFGLAKRLDEEDGQTHSGQVMGSPSFMAPEQARGVAQEIGPTSDIYSLGAILYELLAGRPPFKGGSALETLHQVVHVEPVAPSRLRPGLARDLETICLKCLNKKPSHRYATAELLADDLDRFLARTPIRARRVHPIERGWKWARRKPAAAGLVATGMVLGFGLIFGGWLALAAANARALQVDRLRIVAPEILRQAVAAGDLGDWAAPRDQLRQFLQETAAFPELAGTRSEAANLLRDLKHGEENQGKVVTSRAKRAEFLGLARFARLSDAHRLLAEAASIADPRPVRLAADAALGAIGTFDHSTPEAARTWRRTESFARLGEADRAEVDLACRELILLRAEVIGQPAPGEDSIAQARAALAILDQARADGPATKAVLSLRSRLMDQAGDHDQGRQLRLQAEATAATDALDRVAAGRELQSRGEWSRAIAEFEAAQRLDPNQLRCSLALAVCELLAGQPEAARVGLTACLQLEPKSVDLLVLRGAVNGKAASLVIERSKGTPRSAAGRVEADQLFQAAEDDFAAAARHDPNSRQRTTLLLNRGIVRVRASRFADARDDFAEILEREPDHLAARVNLGQVFQRLGQTAEAIAAFDRAIQLDPGRAALYRARALARLGRRGPVSGEDTSRAFSDLDEAIHLAPAGSSELASYLTQRARLHHRAGDFAAALADSDRALEIGPHGVEATLVRIQTLLELKRTAEVIQACGVALNHQPELADLWELRGVARSDQRDFRGAIGDFTHILTLDPGRTSARILRGWAYLVSAAPQLALADFQAVLDQVPDLAEAYGGRGFAHALIGHHQLAIADAEESLKRCATRDPRISYNAARIYARLASDLASRAASNSLNPALAQASGYEDRALALIREAVEALPAERRAPFWRSVVQNDPVFDRIRQRSQYARLAGQTGRPAP